MTKMPDIKNIYNTTKLIKNYFLKRN